jgi:hypothetical protein
MHWGSKSLISRTEISDSLNLEVLILIIETRMVWTCSKISNRNSGRNMHYFIDKLYYFHLFNSRICDVMYCKCCGALNSCDVHWPSILDTQGLQLPASRDWALFTLGLNSSQFCSRSLFPPLSILPLRRSSQFITCKIVFFCNKL